MYIYKRKIHYVSVFSNKIVLNNVEHTYLSCTFFVELLFDRALVVHFAAVSAVIRFAIDELEHGFKALGMHTGYIDNTQ